MVPPFTINSKLKAQNSKLILDLLAVTAIFALGVLIYYGRQELPDAALQRVQASHTLRVGMDPTFAPFGSFVDGKLMGYDVDLAAYIAGAIGPDVRWEIVPIATDALYSKLAADNVDVLISALPFVYERSADVIYSRAYFDAAPRLVVPVGSSIGSAADLGGQRVGVELGSDSDAAARRYNRDHTAAPLTLVTYDLPTDALTALAADKLEAAIVDPLTFAAWQAAYPHSASRGIGEERLVNVAAMGSVPYVVAVNRTSKQLARRVDAAIARAQRDGTLDGLAAKWFR